MSDDFAEAPDETPESPAAGPAAAHDDEPGETRDTPKSSATPAAAAPGASPHESDPIYQMLPEAWRKQVREGFTTPLAALQQHNQNKDAAARRRQEKAEKQFAATLQLQQQQEAKTNTRLDQLMRMLSGQEEPEQPPPDPVVQQLAALGQKVDGLGALASYQAQEAQIAQQIDGIENWSAADVGTVLQSVPDYEARESFVLDRMYTGELLSVQQENPDIPDFQAQQLAHQRVQAQVANMIVNYAGSGKSLAYEVAQLSQNLGYAPPAAPANGHRTATEKQIEIQRQRAQSAQTIAAPAIPSTFKGSKETLAAALELSDDEWADFMDGMEGQKRLKSLA